MVDDFLIILIYFLIWCFDSGFFQPYQLCCLVIYIFFFTSLSRSRSMLLGRLQISERHWRKGGSLSQALLVVIKIYRSLPPHQPVHMYASELGNSSSFKLLSFLPPSCLVYLVYADYPFCHLKRANGWLLPNRTRAQPCFSRGLSCLLPTALSRWMINIYSS